MTIQPGQRYERDGVYVDIHFIEDGQVFYRRWPRGVTEMGMWDGLGRCPVKVAEREIEGMKEATGGESSEI